MDYFIPFIYYCQRKSAHNYTKCGLNELNNVKKNLAARHCFKFNVGMYVLTSDRPTKNKKKCYCDETKLTEL